MRTAIISNTYEIQLDYSIESQQIHGHLLDGAASKHPVHKDLDTSVGLCFLRLKKYDQAIAHFEKAQADNFDDTTPFFYAAVSRLKGRKTFLLNRPEIDLIMTNIQAAMDIEPRAEQYYFMSYIKRDYFKRKHRTITLPHPSFPRTGAWSPYCRSLVNSGTRLHPPINETRSTKKPIKNGLTEKHELELCY